MSSTDDAEIRALIARAAHLADEGSLEDYRLVYTPDATWSAGGTTQHGIDEIRASSAARRAEGKTGPGSRTRHIVTPVHINVDGDTAAGVSYFLFLTGTDGVPQIRRFAIYDDAFVRTPDGWRIARRTVRND